MKRLFSSFLSIWSNRFSAPKIETISGKETTANLNEPKVVISSRDDDSVAALSSKFARAGSETKTYRTLVTKFLENEPKAKNGFTTLELHKWMDRSISVPALSKTLNRMKNYGILDRVVNKEDGRIRIWTLVPRK